MKLTVMAKAAEPFKYQPEGSDSIFYLTQFTAKDVRMSFNSFLDPLPVIAEHVVKIENLYVGPKEINTGVELAEILFDKVGSVEVMTLIGQLILKIREISQLAESEIKN